MSRNLIAYGDGSCLGNPGPGGWAFDVMEAGSSIAAHSGGDKSTTNNRMELQAALEALRWARQNMSRGDRLELRMDSRYTLDSMFTWLAGWKRKGWRKSSGDTILNVEIIQDLDREMLGLAAQGITLSHKWVRGHDGEEHNERVDKAARLEAEILAGISVRAPLNDPAQDDPAPADDGRRSVIRLRDDLSGKDGRISLSPWAGRQVVARPLEDGGWQADIPGGAPRFKAADVVSELELTPALPETEIDFR